MTTDERQKLKTEQIMNTIEEQRIRALAHDYWKQVEATGMAYEFREETLVCGAYLSGYRAAVKDATALMARAAAEIKAMTDERQKLIDRLEEAEGGLWNAMMWIDMGKQGKAYDLMHDAHAEVRAVRLAMQEETP